MAFRDFPRPANRNARDDGNVRFDVKRKTVFKDADMRDVGSVTLQNGWDAAYEFGLLSRCYHEAACAAVEALSKNEYFMQSMSTNASFRAFPVIFLYRQALELALKGVIVAGEDMLVVHGVPLDLREVYSSHSFGKLRPYVEAVFKAIGYGFDFGIKGYKSVEGFRKLLSEFDEFDATSTACRYPVDRAGNPSLQNWRCINIFDFAKEMDAILTILTDVPGIVKNDVDFRLENLRETWERAGLRPPKKTPTNPSIGGPSSST